MITCAVLPECQPVEVQLKAISEQEHAEAVLALQKWRGPVCSGEFVIDCKVDSNCSHSQLYS